MTISHRFVLVGQHAGHTANLGGHDFIDGVYEFLYVQDGVRTMPSQDDVKLKAHYLARSYQAFPEGSPELAAAEEAFGRDEPTPAHSEASTPAAREDAEQAKRDEAPVVDRKVKTAVREALLKLDPANEEHWTDAGLPSVNAVRDIAGFPDVSRADIKALAPNLTREEAAKVAAGA
jgi:hypothetical protein